MTAFEVSGMDVKVEGAGVDVVEGEVEELNVTAVELAKME